MKPLKDFTDQELYSKMQNNNEIDLLELAAYSSEILRRILDKDLKLVSSEASIETSLEQHSSP